MGIQTTDIDLGVVFCVLFLITVTLWLAIGVVKHVSYFVMKWWPND